MSQKKEDLGPVAQKLQQCRKDGFVSWLMKSEPDVFSIDDLKRKKKTAWDGVRNYQARNFMTNEMAIGDLVLFYHSNAAPPGVVGLAKISKQAFPDPSAIDPKSPYFDEKSMDKGPRWFCVEVSYVEHFARIVSLDELKAHPKLKSMLVVKQGQRLSIQPCTRTEFDIVRALGQK